MEGGSGTAGWGGRGRSQGYDLYAYVANNPTTWVEPSGHDVGNAMLTAYLMENPDFMNFLVVGVCASAFGAAVVGGAEPTGDTMVRTNFGVGAAFAVCMAVVTARVTVPALVCAMTLGCLRDAWGFRSQMRALGSSVTETVHWTLEELQNAINKWPDVPDLTTVFPDTEPLTVSPERREHILHGDETGGGHLYGYGDEQHAEFPKDWTGDDIIAAIESIANDRKIPWVPQPHGGAKKTDVRDGVEIEVIQGEDGTIVTGYPVYH